jgi:hypothetical protein
MHFIPGSMSQIIRTPRENRGRSQMRTIGPDTIDAKEKVFLFLVANLLITDCQLFRSLWTLHRRMLNKRPTLWRLGWRFLGEFGKHGRIDP